MARHESRHVGVAHPARGGGAAADRDRAAPGQPLPTGSAGGAAGAGAAARAARRARADPGFRGAAALASRAVRGSGRARGGIVRAGVELAVVLMNVATWTT